MWTFLPENKVNLNNDKTNNQKATNTQHPTVKPIFLFRRLLKLFTQKNDIVLDCFMGSGTTALGCIQEGRNFLGCEREEKYIKIANEKIENWKADLSRQDKWLKDKGVCDFQSDIQEEIQITDTLL